MKIVGIVSLVLVLVCGAIFAIERHTAGIENNTQVLSGIALESQADHERKVVDPSKYVIPQDR